MKPVYESTFGGNGAINPLSNNQARDSQGGYPHSMINV